MSCPRSVVTMLATALALTSGTSAVAQARRTHSRPGAERSIEEKQAMADGAIVAVPRATQTADQNIESLEADRGGGVRLIQTVANITVPGATVTHNPKGSAAAPVAVAQSSAALSDANDKSVSCLITNMGTDFVYICTGTATTDMHPLAPGASYNDIWTTKAWTAIAATGTHNVFVMEVLLP